MSQKKTHRTRRQKPQAKQLQRAAEKDTQYRQFVETYQELYATRYSSTSNLIAAGLATALVLE